MPALQAEEAIAAAAAARSAMIDNNDYRRLINRLERLAAPYETDQPIRMAETPEEKEKAAEFFAAIGIRTE